MKLIDFLLGTIPASIGDLASLTVLNLASNHLRGVVPESLCNLSMLNALSLAKNQLTGKMRTVHYSIFSCVAFRLLTRIKRVTGGNMNGDCFPIKINMTFYAY